MLYVKVLCDDRFDPNETHQIDGETVANPRDGSCIGCPYEAVCNGFIFPDGFVSPCMV